MPEYEFHKIVRDKLPADYERLGQQATYHKLGRSEHAQQLINKLIEEVYEINLTEPSAAIAEELADLKQVQLDLAELLGITPEQIEAIRRSKLAKKGGFADGIFVETLQLSDDDVWNDYYRQRPDKYPEIKL